MTIEICECGHLKERHNQEKYFCKGKIVNHLFVSCDCKKYKLASKKTRKKE